MPGWALSAADIQLHADELLRTLFAPASSSINLGQLPDDLRTTPNAADQAPGAAVDAANNDVNDDAAQPEQEQQQAAPAEERCKL